MIKTVKDVQEYVHKDLDENDDIIFQRPCMMLSSGCPTHRLEELKKNLPSIPDSYTISGLKKLILMALRLVGLE